MCIRDRSFAAKGEIENVILSSDSDVIIIDPERAYSQLVRALGGEVIHISATSDVYKRQLPLRLGKDAQIHSDYPCRKIGEIQSRCV